MLFVGDQPFWAAQLQRVGLAGRPLHRDRLSPDGVSAAITAGIGRTERVLHSAERMGTEHGTEAAITHLLNAI